jgi:hypothetical protein
MAKVYLSSLKRTIFFISLQRMQRQILCSDFNNSVTSKSRWVPKLIRSRNGNNRGLSFLGLSSRDFSSQYVLIDHYLIFELAK